MRVTEKMLMTKISQINEIVGSKKYCIDYDTKRMVWCVCYYSPFKVIYRNTDKKCLYAYLEGVCQVEIREIE